MSITSKDSSRPFQGREQLVIHFEEDLCKVVELFPYYDELWFRGSYRDCQNFLAKNGYTMRSQTPYDVVFTRAGNRTEKEEPVEDTEWGSKDLRLLAIEILRGWLRYKIVQFENEGQSHRIQTILFSLGYRWGSHNSDTEVQSITQAPATHNCIGIRLVHNCIGIRLVKDTLVWTNLSYIQTCTPEMLITEDKLKQAIRLLLGSEAQLL